LRGWKVLIKAGFSTPPLANARAAPVEMTALGDGRTKATADFSAVLRNDKEGKCKNDAKANADSSALLRNDKQRVAECKQGDNCKNNGKTKSRFLGVAAE
jgi:hypothetical protein